MGRFNISRILRRIRKKYALCQKTGSLHVGVYEWLTDNYHLYQREGKWVKAELINANLYALPNKGKSLESLCEHICSGKLELTNEKVVGELRSAQLTTFEIDLLPVFYKAVLLKIIDEAIQEDTEKNRENIAYATMELNHISGLDFYRLAEEVSPISEFLMDDPAEVYGHMSKETRAVYRRRVGILARNEGKNEVEFIKERLALAEEDELHIGEFLNLGCHNTFRGKFFIILEVVLPFLLSFAVWNITSSPLLAVSLHLPLWALSAKFVNKAALNNVAPDPILRMDRYDKSVKNTPVLMAVSVLLPEASKIMVLRERLKLLRCANPEKNIKICVLADLHAADSEKSPDDEASIKSLRKCINSLNDEMGGGFVGIVRPREYSRTGNTFCGRERKRGAIEDLVSFIEQYKSKNDFISVLGDATGIQNAKYLYVLDVDTELPMDCVYDLLSAAVHPINYEKYGVFVPSLDVKILDANKSSFAELFAGTGGINAYNGPGSERYQDLFGSSIFAGKGLVNIGKFAEAFLTDEELHGDKLFKDESVLSHDILEGEILKTLFVSDTTALEGFPSNETSFLKRQDRWVRGDFQNLAFVFARLKDGSKLSKLSKYKLLDNVRRWCTPIMQVAALIVGGFTTPIIATATVAIVLFSLDRPVDLLILAQSAYTNLIAGIRGFYRRFISHKKMLEWVTAAQGEETGSFASIFFHSYFSIVVGIFLIFLPGALPVIGIVFIANPIFAYLTAKIRGTVRTVGWTEREKLISYAASAWKYYDIYVKGRDNYLPPDNVQEAPVYRVAHRTSPTNIGFYLLSILGACDFGFIETAELVKRIDKTLTSVEKMKKYKGNLLNWYDTETLEPLRPAYVSTVDSGNFLCLMTALLSGLNDYEKKNAKVKDLKIRLRKLIDDTNISFLYDENRKLFRVGYNVTERAYSESYYDLLMSEARMTGYYAIAARQIPREHWSELSRVISKTNGHFGPLSWTGTAFEFYLPHLLLPVYPNSLSEYALKYCDYCQKRRAKERGVPFGMSESGFYAFDKDLNYQYKAHGIQKLGLKRGLDLDCVVSPYSTFLTLPYNHKSALQNLEQLSELDLEGRCGFYEAVDFTGKRTGGQDYAVVRSYMAHHVGMTFISLSNAAFNNIMQKRFMSDGCMAGAEHLLMERVPRHPSVFKDVEGRKEPIKPIRQSADTKRVEVGGPVAKSAGIYTNGEWALVGFSNGMSRSIYRGVDITTPPISSYDEYAGVKLFFDTSNSPVVPTKAVFRKKGVTWLYKSGKTYATMSALVHPRVPGEIRKITLRNTGRENANIRLYLWANPFLAEERDGMSHPAFTKLFMYDEIGNEPGKHIVVTRNSSSGETISLICGILNNESANPCTSNQKFFHRMDENLGNYSQVDGTGVPDPCVSFEISVNLKPGKTANYDFFIGAADGSDEARRIYSKVAADKELLGDYLFAPEVFQDESPERMTYANLIPELFYPSRLEEELTEKIRSSDLSRNVLWKFGISGNNPVIFHPISDNASLQNALTCVRIVAGLKKCGLMIDLVLCYDDKGDYSAPLRVELDAMLSGEGEVISGNVFTVDISLHDSADIEGLMAASSKISGNLLLDKKQSDIGQFVNFKNATASVKQIKSGQKRLSVSGGYFDDATAGNNAFHMTETPKVPWCVCLANRNFGTLPSALSLGYTWALNSRENKLTKHVGLPFREDDGERILCSIGKKFYDVIKGASVTFTPTSAIYESRISKCRFKVVVYTPSAGMCKRIVITMKNSGNETIKMRLGYYSEPVMGVNRRLSKYLKCKVLPNGVCVSNSLLGGIKGYTFFGLTNAKCDFYLCDALDVLTGNWSKKSTLPKAESCVFIGKDITLTEDETKTLVFTQSFAKTEEASVFLGTEYNPPMPMYRPKLKVKTNDEPLNIMVNTWLPTQMKNCRMFARCGFYQSGGAYGFRDQLQDAMNIQLIEPKVAAEYIIRCATAQFKEGDVLHWWHNFPADDGGIRGIRTHCSDDMLWLPLAISGYVMQTADTSFALIRVPFLSGKPLQKGERERYDSYNEKTERASLYEHGRRAIKVALKFGRHGLLKMGTCDWNDGYSSVGDKGEGESVWLSMFASLVMDKYADFTEEYIENYEPEYVSELRMLSENLKEAVDEYAWDGHWYTRAIYDDGDVMGSHENEECKIDSLTQSFSVLANMPNDKRRDIALANALQYLYDAENGVIRLFWPPFSPNGKQTGYVNFYAPGTRENGGQYTHAAVWLAMATLRHASTHGADFGSAAYNLLKDLNPINKCLTDDGADRYLGEPYALAGDVYSLEPYCGRAGWTHYTGAAGWYYRLIVNEMLGIEIRNGELSVSPSLPLGITGYVAEVEKDGIIHRITCDNTEKDRGL